MINYRINNILVLLFISHHHTYLLEVNVNNEINTQGQKSETGKYKKTGKEQNVYVCDIHDH